MYVYICNIAAGGGSVSCLKAVTKVMNIGPFSTYKQLRDVDGMTIVMYACMYDQSNILSYIMKQTSKNMLLVGDEHGTTPLHIAALHGSTDCVRFLIANGHRVDITDAAGIDNIIHIYVLTCLYILRFI